MDKKCSICGHELGPDFAEKFEKTVKFLASSFAILEKDDGGVLFTCFSFGFDSFGWFFEMIADWELVQECIKRQEGILYPLNGRFIRTLEYAFNVAIALQKWKEAESYGSQLVPLTM